MSPEAIQEKLDELQAAVRELHDLAKLQVQLGYTVPEATFVTRIGQGELRRRCALPETSPLFIRHVRIGTKIVIGRSECERLFSTNSEKGGAYAAARTGSDSPVSGLTQKNSAPAATGAERRTT